METCITCNLKWKRSNKYDYELINTQLAVNNQYYCHQCNHKIILADKNTHLQSDEHKNNRKMWFCDICGRDYYYQIEAH